MKLPKPLWDMRNNLTLPSRDNVVVFATNLWKNEEVQAQLTKDLIAQQNSAASHLIWALLVIHRLQTRIRKLEEDLVTAKAENGDVTW